MPTDPDDLRADAARLRDRAEEIADDNPTAADYHRLRAEWVERLARGREADRVTRP